MTKFEQAEFSPAEIAQTVDSWMVLWKRGDKNTDLVVGFSYADVVAQRRTNSAAAYVLAKDKALARLRAHVALAIEGQIWKNDLYQVICRDLGNGQVHLSIRRLDRSAIHDWRHFQEIKNQLVGPECEAVELYPAESRLVDCANQYHVWAWKDPEFRVPVGFRNRMTADVNEGVGKSQQRPFGGGDDHQDQNV